MHMRSASQEMIHQLVELWGPRHFVRDEKCLERPANVLVDTRWMLIELKSFGVCS